MNREIKTCNCKKSNCLKLYCDCFAAGAYCIVGKCNCLSCMNNVENENKRNRAILSTIERDPSAFRPKVIAKDVEKAHKKGCNCKRSNCLKKYCECYQGGTTCTDKCKCIDCHNTTDGPPQKRHLSNLSALPLYYHTTNNNSNGAHLPLRHTEAHHQIVDTDSLQTPSSSAKKEYLHKPPLHTAHAHHKYNAPTEFTDPSLFPPSTIKNICDDMIGQLVSKVKVTTDRSQTVVNIETDVIDSFYDAYVNIVSSNQSTSSTTPPHVYSDTIMRNVPSSIGRSDMILVEENTDSQPSLISTIYKQSSLLNPIPLSTQTYNQYLLPLSQEDSIYNTPSLVPTTITSSLSQPSIQLMDYSQQDNNVDMKPYHITSTMSQIHEDIQLLQMSMEQSCTPDVTLTPPNSMSASVSDIVGSDET